MEKIKSRILQIIYFVVFTFFLIIPVILWLIFIKMFQQKIIMPKEVLLFTSTFAGLLCSSLIMVLIGILIGTLFLIALNFKYPKFKNTSLKNPKDKLKEIIQVIKIIIVVILISIPILFLCFYNYYYITENNFYYNSFFSLNEKTISLNELERIEVGLYASNYKGIKNPRTANIHYILVFNNGHSYNIRQAQITELLELDNYLMQKEIQKVTIFIDKDSLKYLKEKDSDGSRIKLKILGIN